jgi:hypothetical protein
MSSPFEVLRVHTSVTEAAKFMRVGRGGIAKCCKNERKSSYGFIWRLYEGPPIDCTCNASK